MDVFHLYKDDKGMMDMNDYNWCSVHGLWRKKVLGGGRSLLMYHSVKISPVLEAFTAPRSLNMSHALRPN